MKQNDKFLADESLLFPLPEISKLFWGCKEIIVGDTSQPTRENVTLEHLG